MKICETGWCGFPCTCPGSYKHMDRSDAEALKAICEDRLNQLNCKEASDKHGELMVQYHAVEARVKVLKVEGVLHQVDHLLHRAILSKGNADVINSVSGMRSVHFGQDGEIKFDIGSSSRTMLNFTFDVLNYKGDISVSVCSENAFIQDIFVQLVPTVIYLPADME